RDTELAARMRRRESNKVSRLSCQASFPCSRFIFPRLSSRDSTVPPPRSTTFKTPPSLPSRTLGPCISNPPNVPRETRHVDPHLSSHRTQRAGSHQPCVPVRKAPARELRNGGFALVCCLGSRGR